MLDAALTAVFENQAWAVDAHVRLVERRDAERPVFLEVPFASDAKETIADESYDRGEHVLTAKIIAAKIAVE
jgi:hypothetical protein